MNKIRQEANREIVSILTAFVELFPDQRFNQLLTNLDVVTVEDDYNTESEELLKRIRNNPVYKEYWLD